MTDIFSHGIPHNGVLHATSTDSLLRVHARILRQQTQTVDASNIITGVKGSGRWTQVGRNALPLFNAGLVGTQRQTLYLRSSPNHDASNFGADVLYPVLVRDAEALGIYRALGVPPATVTALKEPRFDIINAINLGRPIQRWLVFRSLLLTFRGYPVRRGRVMRFLAPGQITQPEPWPRGWRAARARW